MNHSMGIDIKVLARDARAPRLAAAGPLGSASPPSATVRAEPMTICWAGQITSQTLRNMVVANPAPIRIDRPAEVVQKLSNSDPRYFCTPRIQMPERKVSRAPKRNHQSARQVMVRIASERVASLTSAKAGVWTKLK